MRAWYTANIFQLLALMALKGIPSAYQRPQNRSRAEYCLLNCNYLGQVSQMFP